MDKKRYHIACNRVFEHAHAGEIRKVKELGTMSAADLDTIVHPNTYFKRSWLLKSGAANAGAGAGSGSGGGANGAKGVVDVAGDDEMEM